MDGIPEVIRIWCLSLGFGCALLCSCDSARRDACADRLAMDQDFLSVPPKLRVMQYAMGRAVDLDTAERFGLGGLVCAVRGDAYYKGEYLRDDAEWGRLTNQVAEATARGLRVWLFDERGYPSGGAGDRVVEQYPHLENIGVYRKTVEGHGRTMARIELPPDARRFVGAAVYPRDAGGVQFDRPTPATIAGKAVSTGGIDGDWVLCAFVERVVHEGIHAQTVGPTFGWKGRYPNLLDPEAVARFIEITHGAYARHLGPELLSKIEAIYSNEPSLKPHWFPPGSRPGGEAYVPWVASLPETFRKMHGYDLVPRMGELFSEKAGEYSRLRLHFYQTVGAIMAESYAGQIARWCRDHGTWLTGHILAEELICYHPSLYGDLFKQIQGFDLPGADMAILQPEEPAAGRFIGVRFVSSAARAAGKRHVQALMDPILGKWVDANGKLARAPIESLIRSANLLFYNGVNLVTIYGPWDQYPADEYLRFNLYVGRLAALLRDAANEARVAVYYPLESFQARYRPTANTIWSEQKGYWDLQSSVWNIERMCHDHGIDHNFLNADALLKSRLRGGAMAVGGCRYRVLLMPAMGVIPLDVLKKIVRFEAAGGRVIWTGALPQLGAREAEDPAIAAILADRTSVTKRDDVLAAILATVPPEFVFECAPEARRALLVSKYVRGGGALFLVINDGAAPMDLRALRCGGEARLKVYDPFGGTISALDAGNGIAIGPRRALVFSPQRGEIE